MPEKRPAIGVTSVTADELAVGVPVFMPGDFAGILLDSDMY